MEPGGGNRAGGAGSGAGIGSSVDGVSRVRSAPQFAGASSLTGAGSSARGVLSARTSEAERNSAMLRHVNAAHSDKRINDKTWSSALQDLEDKTKTQLQLLDRVVYVKREYDELASGPTYERPTVTASLKFRNAGMRGTPAAGWLSSRTHKDTHAASGHHASHFAPRAEHAKSIRPVSARAVLNTRPVCRPTSARTSGSGGGGGGGGKHSKRPASAYVTRQAVSQGAAEKLRATRPSSAGLMRKSHADMLLPYPNRNDLVDRQDFTLEKL